MPYHIKPNRKPGVNTDVSEYIWDLKTRRYKRNPADRSDNTFARYIFWGAVVLVMLIAVVWCLKQ